MRRALALTALLLLVGAGCGGGGGDNDPAQATSLVVTLWPNGENGDSISWDLLCDPAGGDHPDADAACAALGAVADPFGPLPPPERCEEIPGGDEAEALVAGRYRGRPVRARFARRNACVTPRWDRIAPVFPTGF